MTGDEVDRMLGTKRTILFGPYGKGGAIELAGRNDVHVIDRLRDERRAVVGYHEEARDVLRDRESTEHYGHQRQAYDELIGELAIDEPRVVIERYAERAPRAKRTRHL